MRKAVTDRATPKTAGSGRRQWIHAQIPPTAPDAGTERPGKARFLAAYHLDETRRAALLAPLIAAQVGDGDSRDLFVSAVEYDLALLRQAAPAPESAPGVAPEVAAQPATAPGLAASSEPAPRTATPTGHAALADLAGTARVLAQALRDLDAAGRTTLTTALMATDRFERGYGEDYLDALSVELTRLGAVDDPVSDPLPPPAPPPATPPGPAPQVTPPLSPATRRFVRRIARVYEQCLETRALVAPASPFLAVLQALAPEVGVSLPQDPDILASVISDP